MSDKEIRQHIRDVDLDFRNVPLRKMKRQVIRDLLQYVKGGAFPLTDLQLQEEDRVRQSIYGEVGQSTIKKGDSSEILLDSQECLDKKKPHHQSQVRKSNNMDVGIHKKPKKETDIEENNTIGVKRPFNYDQPISGRAKSNFKKIKSDSQTMSHHNLKNKRIYDQQEEEEDSEEQERRERIEEKKKRQELRRKNEEIKKKNFYDKKLPKIQKRLIQKLGKYKQNGIEIQKVVSKGKESMKIKMLDYTDIGKGSLYYQVNIVYPGSFTIQILQSMKKSELSQYMEKKQSGVLMNDIERMIMYWGDKIKA